MSLFNLPTDSTKNLLPADGIVCYYGKLFSAEAANHYLQLLLTGIEWKNDEAYMFGKHIITKRKVAWYGDREFEYSYSNITKKALPWTSTLMLLKTMAESCSGEKFNSCLLNRYHNGSEGMAWHSDDEKDLKKGAAIASLSFGAERKFSFKHKRLGNTVSLILEHGSMLIMKGGTQENWLHRLPPTAKPFSDRVNLTFRLMNEG